MLHVDDDTGDQLFRKAAEDYFLPAEAPDWESVCNKMATPLVSDGSKDKRTHPYMGPFLFCYRVLEKSGSRFVKFFLHSIRMVSHSDRTKKKIDTGPGYLFLAASNLLINIAAI
jgi:hypothetical protein